jgi:hypothetical protein
MTAMRLRFFTANLVHVMFICYKSGAFSGGLESAALTY